MRSTCLHGRMVPPRLRGGMNVDGDSDEESSEHEPAELPGTNQTYTKLMQNFGISEEYLKRLKGQGRSEKKLRTRFVIGARGPEWRRALVEMERNGTHRTWLPLPCTALTYEQPTGLWRPGDDPSDPRFQSGGPLADGHSEAAGGGYAPFNYKMRDAVGGIKSKFPQLWGEELEEDRDEDWVTPEDPVDRGPRWDGTMDADHAEDEDEEHF